MENLHITPETNIPEDAKETGCIPNCLGITMDTEEKIQAAIDSYGSVEKFNDLLRRANAIDKWLEETTPKKSIHPDPFLFRIIR